MLALLTWFVWALLSVSLSLTPGIGCVQGQFPCPIPSTIRRLVLHGHNRLALHDEQRLLLGRATLPESAESLLPFPSALSVRMSSAQSLRLGKDVINLLDLCHLLGLPYEFAIHVASDGAVQIQDAGKTHIVRRGWTTRVRHAQMWRVMEERKLGRVYNARRDGSGVHGIM